MATITIKSRSVHSSKYDEFSSGGYIGAHKRDVSEGILFALPKAATHTLIAIPLARGLQAKALIPIPPLEGLGYQFLVDMVSVIKTGKNFQYFGHSAFVA